VVVLTSNTVMYLSGKKSICGPVEHNYECLFGLCCNFEQNCCIVFREMLHNFLMSAKMCCDEANEIANKVHGKLDEQSAEFMDKCEVLCGLVDTAL